MKTIIVLSKENLRDIIIDYAVSHNYEISETVSNGLIATFDDDYVFYDFDNTILADYSDDEKSTIKGYTEIIMITYHNKDGLKNALEPFLKIDVLIDNDMGDILDICDFCRHV